MKKLTIFIAGLFILLGGCFSILWISKPCSRLDLLINYTGCFRQIDVYHLFTLSFSSDLTMFAAESLDRTTVWRTADAQILYQAPFGELTLFSPDSAFWLLVVLDNQSLQDQLEIWRTEDWTLVKTLNVGTSKVSGVAMSPDNHYLAVASWDNPIQIWRTRDWSLLYTIEGPTDSPNVVYSPDSEILASWSDDKKIELWRTKDGSLLSTLTGHSSAVSKVVFAPDSKTLASSSWDSTVRVWHGLVQLWNVNKGTRIRGLRHNWVGEPVYRVAFSPDGKVLATFQKSGPVRLFDAQQLLGTNGE
ncbi:MAG: hypothetical protein HYR94_21800 [Chloroflexi bacterium]|nr:hypothetical protein [Chloroflexota bacterium]